MGFREVPVFEVKEVLRLWLRGEGLRAIERLARADRKTVRRYVQAAGELGVDRDGGEGQLSDEVLAGVRAGPPASQQRPRRVLAHPRGPRLSTAIRNSPPAVIGIPQGRPREFPTDGHRIPRVLSWRGAPPPCPRWRRSGGPIRLR